MCVDDQAQHAWVGSDDGSVRCLQIERVGKRTCRVLPVWIGSAFGSAGIDSGDAVDREDELWQQRAACIASDVPAGGCLVCCVLWSSMVAVLVYSVLPPMQASPPCAMIIPLLPF